MGCLTKPLLYPLFAQFFGIILWMGLTYGAIDWVTTYFPQTNLWVLWGIFLLANLPGMYLFFNGFWQYLVWLAGFNLMIRELVETGSSQDIMPYYLRITHRSVDYTLIWTFLFGLLFIPVSLGMLPIAYGAINLDNFWFYLALSGLITFVGLVFSGVLMVFFSLVFQVFAYTPGSAGASLFRSMDLVSQNIGKTLIVIVTSMGLTQFLLPSLITSACDLLLLTKGLAHIAEIGVQYILKQGVSVVEFSDDDYVKSAFHLITSNTGYLAVLLARSSLLILSSALLLPLSTCWFALLYADLKTQLDLKKAPLPLSPEVESMV